MKKTETMQNTETKKKKFYQRWWFWLIVIGIIIGGAASTSEDAPDGGEVNTNDPAVTNSPSTSYIKVSVSKMMDDLESNALKAKNTYDGKYVEITGRVEVIDASGKYISLFATDDEWAITGVQCDIKNSEQKAFVMGISTGDIVTVRGKITDVGEVLGYYLDIHEFVK